ncbi:tripartite-type tricarboxylate transporter receptor subunit TctC [Natronocella acetinitrilica]|uniref:Tripartite-type tricarboxylate transporter receptor subunit TctC n=1 Tax=Natronocella acetinitrilica TaxID=414046 RepID=A0AAE3KDT6_9GAMM|nr:tripartite tricarboxylate transporter substrate binding protein [Natronocella acetinitrilica]MCP1677256.1 tripartite-type tricarboxylate transporter receptor subunit TctC [Natronocella acetinitrilica]
MTQISGSNTRCGSALLAAGMLGAAMAFSSAAQADYPERPIQFVVSYASGGSSDIAARSFARAAERHMDGNMVVQNRPGAAGIVGTDYVFNANPDGYTILLARVAVLAVAPALQDVPYDPDEFTYIGLLSSDPFACVTGTRKPYESIDDLAEAIRDNPGAVTYNSSGVGSLNQFAALSLIEALDVGDPESAATHVPAQGEGPALTAVAGGHVDFFCGNLAPMLSQIQSGNVRPLLVTSAERLDDIPDVPTVSELGHPELESLVGWSAIVGPPGMDEEAHTYLRDLMATVSEDEEWRETVITAGSIPHVLPPEETIDFVQTQRAGFVDLVERLDLRDD